MKITNMRVNNLVQPLGFQVIPLSLSWNVGEAGDAIGSSSKNAKFILEKVELLDAFDAISDGNNITHSKPDPEVFSKAGEFLGEKPDNCIVVEDAYAGIDAAKAAGMTAVGIGDASGYDKADVKIQTFSELLKLAE